jgi:hypothetical protein
VTDSTVKRSRHRGGAVLVGLHDPDGIEIRLYAD